ncbi:hypothetical protein PIB30_057468 [Stylosanthes scabra]|uniref:Uncharacterized protein n=1 Tax=Stylosanthes scabra TaxID=79078 RepID=A0ABU6QK50_9FABA|nr:hypothetical protein [Stylosanthes scabra]
MSMIIYFKERFFGKELNNPEALPPWISYWNGEKLREKIRFEAKDPTVQHASNIEDVAWVEIQAQIQACKEAQADIIEPKPDNQALVQAYKVVEAIIEASNEDVECKIGGSKEDKAPSDINKLEKPPQTHATEEEEDDFDRPSFDLRIGSPPIQQQDNVSQIHEARQCEITEDLEKRCVIWALTVKRNNKYETIFKLKGDLYYEVVRYQFRSMREKKRLIF